ncbi:hypothetical protein [Micromonospora sp. NBC_01813]|uniref:hypothetical protein n=1 Tax=Micromonospora sp. NBC_01813 TaxID=2975988 RepID=UPI002DD8BDE3|nr:hypothetical protein [Micromonospora sp. NBC_01813]WSA08353.1 hypothetical protein OG958_29885 [Micromonospora sp. NBC_01813]
MITSIRDRAASARTAASRATLAPLLVRAALAVVTLLALLLAYPGPGELGDDRLYLALFAVAMLPALAPRGHAPTVAILIGVVGWVLATTAYGVPVQLWRLLAVGSLLYLTHSLAALAAALPYDVVLSPEVPVRWLVRVAGVLLASAVLVVLLLAVAGQTAGQPFLLAVLAGLAVGVGAVALLAALVKRR